MPSKINPEDHIALIFSIAKKLMKKKVCQKAFGTNLYAYLGPGFLGLDEAIKKYNADIAAFSTYASKYIYHYIMEEAKKLANFIHVPRYLRTAHKKFINGEKITKRAEEYLQYFDVNQRLEKLSKFSKIFAKTKGDEGDSQLRAALEKLKAEYPEWYRVISLYFGLTNNGHTYSIKKIDYIVYNGKRKSAWIKNKALNFLKNELQEDSVIY